MSKKMMLLALAAVSAAMFAMPAAASATPWHLTGGLGNFTISSAAGGYLEDTGGNKVVCTKGASGSGSFTNSTTGTLTLTFSGCEVPGVGECRSGAAVTHITANAGLTFHAAMLGVGSPGILITPPPNGVPFAHFTCYIGWHPNGGTFPVATKTVTGNGVLGTITAPKCGAAAQNTAEIAFEEAVGVTGNQKHIEYTGVKYDLLSNGTTAAIVQKSTLTFPVGQVRGIQCT